MTSAIIEYPKGQHAPPGAKVPIKATYTGTGRSVKKTLTLPANVPLDETFYVAATAVSVCDTAAGDYEGPWVLA